MSKIELKISEGWSDSVPVKIEGDVDELSKKIKDILNKKDLVGLEINEEKISFLEMYNSMGKAILDNFSQEDLLKIYRTLDFQNKSNASQGKPEISNDGIIKLFKIIEDEDFEEKRNKGEYGDFDGVDKYWVFIKFNYSGEVYTYLKKYPKVDEARKEVADKMFKEEVLPILKKL